MVVLRIRQKMKLLFSVGILFYNMGRVWWLLTQHYNGLDTAELYN